MNTRGFQRNSRCEFTPPSAKLILEIPVPGWRGLGFSLKYTADCYWAMSRRALLLIPKGLFSQAVNQPASPPSGTSQLFHLSQSCKFMQNFYINVFLINSFPSPVISTLVSYYNYLGNCKNYQCLGPILDQLMVSQFRPWTNSIAASTSSGNLLEMNIQDPYTDLLNQNFWWSRTQETVF